MSDSSIQNLCVSILSERIVPIVILNLTLGQFLWYGPRDSLLYSPLIFCHSFWDTSSVVYSMVHS